MRVPRGVVVRMVRGGGRGGGGLRGGNNVVGTGLGLR